MLAFASGEAAATEVFVTSITPSQVQIVVNGNAIRALRPNEVSPEGVRLLDIRNGMAVLQVDGRTLELGLGQATQRSTVLRADRQGHFMVQALINNVPVPAVIDTGATAVSITWNQAVQMGIDPRQGQRAVTQTAAGPAAVWMVTLARVQVGDIILLNVPGTVSESVDRAPIVLIGMSFLRHVDMRRSGDTMTLSRPSF